VVITKQLSMTFTALVRLTVEADLSCMTETNHQLLGEDHGANAIEYALAALSSCLTTTLIYHAAAQGVVIDEVETTLSGDVDLQGLLGMSENVRNGYEKIKVAFKVKSEAPKEKVRELVELAQKRSPVFDIISNPTPIEVSLEEQTG